MSISMDVYGEVKTEGGEWRPTHDWTRDEAGYKNRLYTGGSYVLYGIIGGVGLFPPYKGIFADRDLPSDCCDELLAEYNRREYTDVFCATWIGLWELIERDWNRMVPGEGYVPFTEYRRWKSESDLSRSSRPSTYSLGVHNYSVVSEEYAMTIPLDCGGEMTQVYAEWEVPEWEIAQGFIGAVVGQLGHLGPDNVRLIVWFNR